MAARVDNEPKSFGNQTILSHSPRYTKIQNKAHTKNISSADWTWDDEGLPTPVSPE